MYRLWAIAALCCGCDVVWRIDHVSSDAASGEVLRYIAPGDYDGDGTPNDSDPCPYVARPADLADRDGDGVGDACDPNPNTAGDCFVLFDGFKDTISEMWVNDSVQLGIHYSWSLCTDPGEPVYCSPRAGATSWLYYTGIIDPPTLVRAQIVMWNGSASMITTIGVSADVAPATLDVSGRFCEMRQRPTSGAVEIAVEAYTSGIATGMTVRQSVLPFDNTHPFLYEWSGTDCEVIAGSALDSLTVPSSGPIGPYVGVRTDHADINLYWVAALRTGCP